MRGHTQLLVKAVIAQAVISASKAMGHTWHQTVRCSVDVAATRELRLHACNLGVLLDPLSQRSA